MLSRSLGSLFLLTFANLSQAAVLTNPAVDPGQISNWASLVVDFSPGPQDINVAGSPVVNQGTPNHALGARDSSTVSLGDGGSLTVSFDTPIQNMAGADFAVFENAFSFQGLVFAELGLVSVSSNGTDFSTFETSFDNPEISESFGSSNRLIDVEQTNNLAGVHTSTLGTGFELSDLSSDALVLSGLVDINAILFIRITDAIGNGSILDSAGNGIFDPYPTALGSGGFDLDAIGVIAPVPIPAPLFLLGSAVMLIINRKRFEA